MDNPDTNAGASGGDSSRRSLLRTLGIGGAVAAVGWSARPANAQETTTPAEETPATTAPPPRAPSQDDRPLLAAAKVMELTMANGYRALTAERVAGLGFDAPTQEFLLSLEPHHRAYAESINALYGPGAPRRDSEALAATLNVAVLASGDAAAVLETAQAIEEAAVDTHLELLGSLQGTSGAALAASIQIVEARHAAVLARLRGLPYDATAPATEDGADALTAADITGGL